MKDKYQNKKSPKTIGTETTERSKFLYGLSVNPKGTIFNWAFKIAITMTVILFLISLCSTNSNIVNKLELFFDNYSFNLLEISIGAIGVLISAITIILAVFDRKALIKIAVTNQKKQDIFISLAFPYRFAATLWLINAFTSLLYNILSLKSMSHYFYYLWFFFVVYAFSYMLYLLAEIINYVLLGLLISSKNINKK